MRPAAVRMLLIEDCPEDVTVLRIALERDTFASYQITVVDYLRDGLAQIAQNPFDVILVDLGLPDSQGLETFRQLHEVAGDTPIVALSGSIDEAVALRVVQAGAQDYVVKDSGGWKAVVRAVRYAIERHQAQDQLRASEKYWRTLIAQSNDGIALVDAEGVIRYESPAVTRLLGYTAEELIGRSGFDLLHPGDHASAAQFFAEILNRPGEPVVSETHFLHKHGEDRWVEATSTNWLDDPDLHAIIINLRDITERKQAELAMREKLKLQEQLEKTASIVPGMIHIFKQDAAGAFSMPYASLACWDLYGMGPEEVAQDMAPVFTRIDPQDIPHIQAGIADSARTLTPWRGEFRYHHPLRGQCWYAGHSTPVAEPDGSVLWYGIIQDITERKEIEALIYAQRDLARSIGTFKSTQDGFRVILDTVLKLTGLDSGGIYLLDPSGQRMDLIHHQGLGATFAQVVSSFPHDSTNVQMILPGKPFYFSSTDPIVQNPLHQIEQLRSLAVIPVLHQERVIGCLNLASHVLERIPPFAPRALETLAAEIGNVVVHLQSQAALRASEEQFRQIAETINEVFWIFDNQQRQLIYLNPAYAKVWGVSIEKTYQDNQTFIQAIHPDDRPIIVAALDRQAQGEHTEMEYRVVHPDGTTRWIFDRSFPIMAEDGRVLRTTGVATDITERKRVEESLKRRMEDLALINRLNDAVNHGESLIAITEMLAEETRTIFGSLSASLYLMDRQKKRLILQHFTMPPATIRRLERLLGRDLPLIEIPVGGDDHFSRILDAEGGAIYAGFEQICAWLGDFANSSHIPDMIRPLIPIIVPVAARLLNIRSVLSMPLKAGKEVLGLIELTAEGTFDQTALERLQNVRQQLTEVIIRRQAEESLRESEEKYRGLAEASDALIMLLDAEGRIHYLNERAAAVQGLPLQEALGKTLYELLPPSAADVYVASIQDLMIQGRSMVIESPIGETYYRTSIQPIHDERGRVTLAMLSAIDITELKLAQWELQELNRSLEERVSQRTAEVQDLYDNAPTGYHSLNGEGQIIMINRTEANWLCYPREAIIGRHINELLTPDSQEAFQRIFPIFKRRGYMRDIELEFTRNDRSTFPALVNATAIYDADGNYIQSRSTVFDITDRKRAERALRESEEQNRLLFESAPDAVVLLDAAGQIVRMNHSFAVLSGLSIEQGIGNTLDALGLLPADQVSRLADAVVRALQHTDEYAAAECKLQRRNGELRDVGVRVYGMSLRGSQHFLTSMRDITVEKQAEETLRYANVELERALRMKDEFLANMSHELRTPLHGILATSEALLEHLHGPLNERQQRSVRLIEDSGRHLLALINDLLDISKIEAGKLELYIDAVLVDDICHASLQFVREMALKKQIQVDYTNTWPGARLSADAKRLKQMLVNLLSNAVKFTPEGGQVGLSVAIDRGAGLIHFAVQDTGPGITPANQARLFQPFTQLDAQLSRQYEGTGLGLALVKRLAEQHGGTIRLESAGVPGQGCRFTLTLPHSLPDWVPAPAAPPVLARAVLTPQPGQSGPLVLLVEDNDVNIEVIGEFLEHAGYRLVVARTGLEGLELAAAHAPDLILMDIQLPLLDGFEAIRRLRAQLRFTTTPIIAITASAMAGDRERCLSAGATDYLSKPLRLKELLGMVKTLTGSQRH